MSESIFEEDRITERRRKKNSQTATHLLLCNVIERSRRSSMIHVTYLSSREGWSQMRPIRGQIGFIRTASLASRLRWSPLQRLLVLILLSVCFPQFSASQCNGLAATPQMTADCAAHAVPQGTIAPLDAAHSYSLAELIDLAERNNPRTRIA